MVEQDKAQALARDFINPNQHSHLPVPLPKVDFNYQDLTNLACCLDVVATVLVGHDEIGVKELFKAISEGASYNGASSDDILTESEHFVGNLKNDWAAMAEDLMNCSESLVNQLVLELEEQRVTKGQRI